MIYLFIFILYFSSERIRFNFFTKDLVMSLSIEKKQIYTNNINFFRCYPITNYPNNFIDFYDK